MSVLVSIKRYFNTFAFFIMHVELFAFDEGFKVSKTGFC